MDSTRPRTDRVNTDGTYWCDREVLCRGKLTQLSSQSTWYRHRPKRDSTRTRMAQRRIVRAERVRDNQEIRIVRRQKSVLGAVIDQPIAKPTSTVVSLSLV